MCFTVFPAHILLALLLLPSCSPCPAGLLYRALFSPVYSNTVISTLSCPGHSHHQQQKQHLYQPNSHPSPPTPQVELLVRCAQDVGTTDSDVYNSASRAGGPSTGNEIQVPHTAHSNRLNQELILPTSYSEPATHFRIVYCSVVQHAF